MKAKQLFPIVCLAICITNACKKEKELPKPAPPDGPPYVTDYSFKVIAYMPSYRDPGLIDDGKYKMITHLFYAFLRPNELADGTLLSLENQSNFLQLQAKAKANGIKYGISVSGAETIFAKIVKSTSARANFVKNITNFASVNNLAGVDIDWEYPRTAGGLPSAGFTALMKELSAALHKEGKFLSAAITPAVYPSTNRDAIAGEVYQDVDFFNIMQYDGAGYDSSEPLNHASYKMSVASLNTWIDVKGMPRDKAIIGIPLYGRAADNSSISYRAIEASGADLHVNLANVGGKDYGFNGIDLVKQKAQLAKDRANGIMFWEFSHDTNTANSLIKAANDQLGRAY